MALHGNYSVLNKGPGRWRAGTSTAVTAGVGSGQANLPSNWSKIGAQRNAAVQDGATAAVVLYAIPTGYGPIGWMMPITAGGISSFNSVAGTGAFTGNLAAGRALAGEFTGAASFAGTGQLVVSGSGTFSGTGTFSGNIVAALAASGTFAGAGSATGAITAKAFASGTFTGTASFTATRYATGSLSGSFSSPVELDASSFSAYLLDREDIETGMTLRQALRLVAAASAGKISGASGTTITIRNPVADTRDRITATVDADGNRTAITYDLTD